MEKFDLFRETQVRFLKVIDACKLSASCMSHALNFIVFFHVFARSSYYEERQQLSHLCVWCVVRIVNVTLCDSVVS